MAIQRFFTTGITYKVPVLTKGSMGGQIATLGAAVDLLGRIRPMDGEEILSAKRINIVANSILYCFPEANLTVKCPVYYDGVTYEVVYIKNPMTYGKHWMVYLVVVE